MYVTIYLIEDWNLVYQALVWPKRFRIVSIILNKPNVIGYFKHVCNHLYYFETVLLRLCTILSEYSQVLPRLPQLTQCYQPMYLQSFFLSNIEEWLWPLFINILCDVSVCNQQRRSDHAMTGAFHLLPPPPIFLASVVHSLKSLFGAL